MTETDRLAAELSLCAIVEMCDCHIKDRGKKPCGVCVEAAHQLAARGVRIGPGEGGELGNIETFAKAIVDAVAALREGP